MGSTIPDSGNPKFTYPKAPDARMRQEEDSPKRDIRQEREEKPEQEQPDDKQ
jgi:hypothetical protein